MFVLYMKSHESLLNSDYMLKLEKASEELYITLYSRFNKGCFGNWEAVVWWSLK